MYQKEGLETFCIEILSEMPWVAEQVLKGVELSEYTGGKDIFPSEKGKGFTLDIVKNVFRLIRGPISNSIKMGFVMLAYSAKRQSTLTGKKEKDSFLKLLNGPKPVVREDMSVRLESVGAKTASFKPWWQGIS